MALFSRLPSEAKQEFLGSTLGSSHVTISQKSPEPKSRAIRGSKGITAHGRSQVRCAAQWLEERHGLKHLSFITCTLPPAALAECKRELWAEIVRRFQMWLRYHLLAAGLSPLLVSVTEIQEKRWSRDGGQPPLHLHLLCQGRKVGASWAFRPESIQEGWAQACQSVLGDVQEFQSSTRVESLRSSSVNYLGKYMSKGGNSLSEVSPEHCPASWYSVSTKLKKMVKRAEVRLSGYDVHAIYEYLYSADCCLWVRSVMSEFSDTGTCYLMAWIGALRGRGIYWELVESIRGYIRHNRLVMQ